MKRNLIYSYEILLFILPTITLIWVTYNISVLRSFKEPILKHISYILVSILCVLDMLIYGCFFRMRNLYNFGNDVDLIISQTLYVLFGGAFIYYLLRDKKKHELNNALIVEAVDEFPGGLSFSDKNGVPILVNKKMYLLIYEILNIPFIDANQVWAGLIEKSEKNKYRPKLFDDNNNLNELYYKLHDGNLWCFRKSILTSGEESFVQIEAADVSRLARIADEISNDNEALKRQNKRIQLASFELEKLNRDKEKYFAKVALHGEFGEYILWLRQFYRDRVEYGIYEGDLKVLEERWYKAIDMVKGISVFSETAEMESELIKVGELIGCKISFPKKKPYKKYRQLFYSAVREALTNAVRHGCADELYVQIEEEWSFQKITIWDNGSKSEDFKGEGNGINTLRKLMEKEGAILNIETENVFRMIIIFPYKGE